MSVELSIIIVNYNTFTLTSNCISSIYKKLHDVSYEIILVDNASTECCADEFLEKFPQIKLIKSPENLGFAKGNNLGIKQAQGKHLLLLNSDTELINNAPKICLDILKQKPEIGIITGKLFYPDGRIQHNCRRFRTITWELLEVFPLYKLLPKSKREPLMLHHYFDYQTPIYADWVWGTFMLFKKQLLENLPEKKLSEQFFMYCEDVLWCWQIQQQGYKIYFTPEAHIMHVHMGSAKSKEQLSKTNQLIIKNHLAFMQNIYHGWKWYIFKFIYLTKQIAFGWLKNLLNR